MSLTIGVVIPCYKPHIGVLKNVLDSIEKQTQKPNMVIVSCSSSDESDIPYKHEDYSYPLKIYTHREKRNISENKNFGTRLINTDIVVYFDADDIMHPQRIEIIYNGFIKNPNMKLLLHSYRLNPTDFNYPIYDINNINYEIDPYYICRWGSVQLKRFFNKTIHNSHAAIKKSLFDEIQYVETPDAKGFEDTLFNRTLINKYPNSGFIGYCDYELTWYYPSGTQGTDTT